MNLLGPDFVMLEVDDLSRSEKFYTDVIGLTRAPLNRPGAVVFATQPIPFGIRTAPTTLSSSAEPSLRGQGVSLWFYTDDAPALHDRLNELGVVITQPLSDSPFGKMFVFRDPDGYLLTAHDGK